MTSCCCWVLIVSLITGSTTGIPMSPGYGRYQTSTPPPYYTTTYATTSYYTEAPDYHTAVYAAPAYYTEAPKYYTTKAPEYPTT
jgi:hypothetical protein